MLLFADVWMIVIWVHVLDYFHSKLCQEEKHFLNSPPTPYKIKFATSNNKYSQNIFTFLGNGNFHVSIHSALDVHILFTIWKINVHINLRLLHMFYDSIGLLSQADVSAESNSTTTICHRLTSTIHSRLPSVKTSSGEVIILNWMCFDHVD